MTPSPLVDLRNQTFLLNDVLDLPGLLGLPAFAGHEPTAVEAVLDAAHTLACEVFLPQAAEADREEPRFVDGGVQLPDSTRSVTRAYAEGGFNAAAAPAEYGGLGLPYTVALAADGLFMGANTAAAGYGLLTRGAAHLLLAHGSPEQIRRYAEPLLAGRFFGTMCLSEPQAGSSLGDIRTRAIPQPDGSYRLEGQKMWISSGEHTLGETIIHLVLARIEGAQAGTRGISLFVVPRNHVGADGQVGERNDVQLAGLNHKLGQRGIVNTVLKFGERGACVAELVGQPQQGLAAMFHMMNEARIGVGIGAVMLAYRGYLYALQYARERRQGRPIDNRDPESRPVPIIEHADVRRLLLRQRALVEGGYALCLYAARLVDLKAHANIDSEREEAARLLDLLTPIVKAWCSEFAVQASDHAIQVLGGYGYTREYPVEQLWRDNRLNPIHEGTNGIQAIDLLARKALADNGAALRTLIQRIEATLTEAAADPDWVEATVLLRVLAQKVGVTAAQVASRMQRGETALALANASHYMTAAGHLVVGWLWLQQALAARRALVAGRVSEAFCEGKRQTCRYFLKQELPQAKHAIGLVAGFEDSFHAMRDEWF
jgi:alkylation response protein AidB-like acyl-CoA dehydrogenase